MLSSALKTFFEQLNAPGGGLEDIGTIIVADYDEVSEAILQDMEYPLLWVLYPFDFKKVVDADIPKQRWSIEALVLQYAEPDDRPRIAQNFDDCQAIGERFLAKLREQHGTGIFEFDENDDTEEWKAKRQFGADNCNGWLIPFKILTHY